MGRSILPPDTTTLLGAMHELRARLRKVGDGDKAAWVAAREAAVLFRADGFSLASVRPASAGAAVVSSPGSEKRWDAAMLGAFIRNDRLEAPPGQALGRLRRRGRPWGAIALAWEGGEVGWPVRNALTRVANVVSESLHDLDRARLLEVRARIDRKIMEQARPRDLFYHILDGLRSLTRYDHSATLLISSEDGDRLQVAAEQLAFRKGKSDRIGEHIATPVGLRLDLSAVGPLGFSRGDAGWEPWDRDGPATCRDLLAATLLSGRRSGAGGAAAVPLENQVLLAPVLLADGPLAVIQLAALHHGSFGPHEIELMSAFVPQVAVAMQNSRRTESLHAKMLEAERKSAIADLARGVSHDINNALGAILPLVQQMRADTAEGRIDARTFQDDLDQIERSVRVCTRIFGGMLGLARSRADHAAEADLARALDSAMAVLGDSLRRRSVSLSVTVPQVCPRLGMGQTELEQLLLNLLTNAKDAMQTGGELRITLVEGGVHTGEVELVIEDTGPGMTPEVLARIEEPFFTTKPGGNGLGLSICRSIITQARGRMHLSSEPGRGTSVRLALPVHRAATERA